MLTTMLLPKSAHLEINEMVVDQDMLILKARSTQTEAICPYCRRPSGRVHSHYSRCVADLPWAEWRVCLELTVRRFFCDEPLCRYKTFAERFPETVAPFARRTLRLALRQRQTALALGGEAGAKLTPHLVMPTSGDTLLRQIRATPVPATETPRVLGVDDWAWRKGQRYGTILVDLERHQPCDLLADRSAESLAAWLQAHPGVEIICRDRANEYIEGANQGAPQAQQVADRWHLLQNLREALERLLDQHPACLLAAAAAEPPVLPPAPATPPEIAPPSPKLTKTEQNRQATRERRLARYQTVMDLKQQGLSKRAIARQVGLDARTVRRYVDAGTFPEMAQRRKGPSILDPYLPYLQQRWTEGQHNASQLFRDIRGQGYRGCQSMVGLWAATQRQNTPKRSAAAPPSPPKPAPPRPWSAAYAVWLLLKTPTQLRPEQQAALKRMLQASPAIQHAYNFSHAFRRIVCGRLDKALEPWLQALTHSDLAPLRYFAVSLARDKTAVSAALSLPWSNGQTEGQINRLKFLKRQMYGRAKFDLLRLRVLMT
jgi:transposase